MLGQNWLSRAQQSLAKIHLAEHSSPSSHGSIGDCGHGNSGRQNKVAQEAEARISTSDYVEARAILFPAVEYFKSAVVAARAQGVLTGKLLSMVSSLHARTITKC